MNKILSLFVLWLLYYPVASASADCELIFLEIALELELKSYLKSYKASPELSERFLSQACQHPHACERLATNEALFSLADREAITRWVYPFPSIESEISSSWRDPGTMLESFRTGKLPAIPDKDLIFSRLLLAQFISALNKAPKYQGTVYRILTIDKDYLASIKTNYDGAKLIEWDSFAAGSAGKYSEDFLGDRHKDKVSIGVVINSINGRDIRSIFPEQNEIIFTPFSKFHVEESPSRKPYPNGANDMDFYEITLTEVTD